MKHILCSVLIVLFLSSCHFLEKAQINSAPDLKGYFVDANNGDDENSGKQLDSPWKTVEKINSIIFEPGDNIYFKRGTSYSHVFRLMVMERKTIQSLFLLMEKGMLQSLQIPITVFSMGMQFK